MSTELRQQGFTCQVVHFFQFFKYTELIQLLDNLVGDKTLIIGFSSTFFLWGSAADQISILKKANIIIDYAKLINLKVKFILGGASPFSMTETIEDISLKEVDAIFDGFPEYFVCKYTNALYHNHEIPVPTKISKKGIPVYVPSDYDFDFSKSQIIYAPEDYIVPGEAVVLEVARGCIFKCSFCTFRLNGKKKLDYIKDPEVLRTELIRNYNHYKIQYYIISDDTFNDSTEKLRMLHAVFTSLPFKIKFSTYLRLDLLYHNREQIQLLKEMGLVGAMFGVESFHNEAARSVGKGLTGEKSKMLLDDLKKIHWGSQVKIEVALITGLPYETLESYEETKQWIKDQTKDIDLVRVNFLRIENPDTSRNKSQMSEFTKNATKYGYYWKDGKHDWHNNKSEITNSYQADNMRLELDTLARKSFKFAHGGFTLFGLWNQLQKTNVSKVTFDDLLNMNRKEFAFWRNRIVIPNIEKIRQDYISNYKRNFGL
jgi:MoaA/NifB/PqqE/SkfB family radical SAM enzyme